MDNRADIYPVTIIRSRYGGVYEGGRWAALDCSHEEVPAGAIGDDVECAEFWALARAGKYEISDWRAQAEESLQARHDRSKRHHRFLTIGAGQTPDAALASLVETGSVR